MAIGIHQSVEQVFPAEHLRDMITDVGDVTVVPDERSIDACEALVTFDYDPSFLDADLRWIHSVQAGVDRFPFDELSSRGIRLTNSTGIHGDTVGEMAVGYMTSLARRLHVYRSNQEAKEWQPPAWDEAFTLAGEPITVVGLGTLGRGVASRADCMRMRVTGVRRKPTPVDHVETVHTPADLTSAITDARFVVITVPLTDATAGMFGPEELGAMRSDAYLVNVARGAVVDQEALVEALESGEIAGAALDVFEEEPLPRSSPLWTMDDVIVTPHVAAATRDYADRIAELVRENCRRLDGDESLVNAVV